MRNTTAIILVTVFLLFSFPLITDAAEVRLSQEDKNISLAVSGPMTASVFRVVKGMNLTSRISVENTGSVVCNISLGIIRDSGPVAEDAIVFYLPSVNHRLGPHESISFNVGVFVNTSERVVSIITVVGIGVDVKGNPISAGVGARVEFYPSGPAYELTVKVIDQNEIPYSDLDISLSRESRQYCLESTDDNGTVWYLLTNGTYVLKFFRDGELIKSMDIGIWENRTIQVTVHRPESVFAPVATIHLLELGLGAIAGYFIHILEVKYRKRRKWKNEKFVPEKNSKSVAESTAEEIG